MEQKCAASSLQVLEGGFLECRCRLLEVAALLDRIDRYREPGRAREDFRYLAIAQMLEVLGSGRPERTVEILTRLSDPTSAPHADLSEPGRALGAWERSP